ncbi:MAG TPA: PilZ domain-containing protein [Terriglobia bacterium]|nr:PilZ domain-containing protein [Terriglobia bacterium]
MRGTNARYTFEQGSFFLPQCSTLLTESSAEKTRHPAVLLSLSATGARFSSRKKVIPGEAVGLILHPDLRYAIRGRVSWTRPMQDDVNLSFGVDFEEEIPESLWDILREKVSAAEA